MEVEKGRGGEREREADPTRGAGGVHVELK